MSRRFNSQEYLDAYAGGLGFPRIHDAIMEGARLFLPRPAEAGRVLDLACSTGLLGARLKHAGYRVAFLDRDADALRRGGLAGTINGDPVMLTDVLPDTLPAIGTWLTLHGIETVVARRCLCVISDHTDLPLIRDTFAEAGVKRVLLEGQRQDSRAVQKNGGADEQAAGLAPAYTLKARHHIDVRYLEIA